MSWSKEWACEHGCDLSTGVVCPHLERLLPPMWEQEVRVVDTTRMSMDVFQTMRPSFNLNRFQDLMRNYGFVDQWDLDLLTAKWFYGRSLRQIAEELNYVSFKTVQRRLKRLQALLVERGFEQECWSWKPNQES